MLLRVTKSYLLAFQPSKQVTSGLVQARNPSSRFKRCKTLHDCAREDRVDGVVADPARVRQLGGGLRFIFTEAKHAPLTSRLALAHERS